MLEFDGVNGIRTRMGRKKENPEGVEPIGGLYGNLLRLTSSPPERAEQCFEPIAHGDRVLSGVGHRFLLCRDYSCSGYVRRVRFLVRGTIG